MFETEHPPMRAWKYLEPQYAADAARHARFKIGTAFGYAALEADPQQDEYDSAQVRTFPTIVVKAGERSRAQQEQLDALGIVIDPRCDNTTIGATGVYVQTGYALCLSASPDNGHAFGDKTAIIEIACVETLAHVLNQNNPELPPSVTFGPVQYDEIERPFGGGPRPRGNAFIKRPKFRPEQEIRMLWRSPVPSGFLARPGPVPPGLLRWINPKP